MCVMQVANGDAVLAVLRELGNERRHRIGQADAALFHQHHHGRRGGHHLGQRRQVEDRVQRHRLGRRLHRALAVRLPERDLIATAHHDHGAGKLPGLDRVGDDLVDAVQRCGVETRLRCLRCGKCLQNAGGHREAAAGTSECV